MDRIDNAAMNIIKVYVAQMNSAMKISKIICEHENQLLEYATNRLEDIEGIRIIGTAKNKVGVLSFVHEKAHHYDIGTIMDQLGVAIRTGHHCTEPLMRIFNVSGTARASFAFYNTKEEVDRLVEGVKKAQQMLS